MIIYAKSNPEKTLKEHTEDLINEYKILKDSYEYKLNDYDLWDILLRAVEYHDAGKIYSYFQNRIRENMSKDIIDPHMDYDIPHNYLSPAFIPYKSLGYSKNYRDVLIQAVAYHHERNKEPNSNEISYVIEKELKYKVNEIRNELNIEVPDDLSSLYTACIKSKNRITCRNSNYNLYVLVKGLLNRIDYAASAGEKIELDTDENVGEYTENYMDRKGFELRDVQKFSKENRNKDIIIIASTGIGKTESALLWIDNDKAFFTLPLRVSINALYDRVAKKENKLKDEDGMGFTYAGLLHSTSMEHLEDCSFENWEEIYDQSRLLSNKLIFTTIDQIFKFPFKYKGYESMYATMAYSKIVIDEIQAYSPNIAAVLLVGLVMIHKIGGKFMIMTATLPPIYIDYLKNKGVLNQDEVVIGKFLNNKVIRHKINVKDKSLISDVNEIIKRGKTNKVIVIVNTVDRAVEVYNEIKKSSSKVHLLHSLFMQKDRSLLEANIKKFAEGTNNGIWVTTQIVEASLDIDFDYLFTELSTLDSFFQRLGRCYRKRPFDLSEPNVYVYTQDVKGIGTIYDEFLWNDSKKRIKEYDMQELTEESKIDMVEKLYSKENLRGTKYIEEFNNAIKLLENISEREISKSEAQEILRNIDNIQAIPREVFDNLDEIEKYRNSTEKEERKKLRRDINKYTLSIPKYKTRKDGIIHQCDIGGLENYYVIEREYEFDNINLDGRGIMIGKELENIW